MGHDRDDPEQSGLLTVTGKARPVVQTVCAILFFALLAFSFRVYEWGLPADLFLRLDPLGGISSVLATRSVALRALWALPLLALAMIFGRFFCGWMCPLGSILDLVGMGTRKLRKPTSRGTGLRHVKYLILAAMIAVALLGINLSWFLDPIPVLTRAFSIGVLASTPLALIVAWGVLAVILLLELIGRRFWCRALCPLGALLGVASLRTVLRRNRGESCDECQACVRACPVGMELEAYHPSECLQCRRCAVVCPQDAIAFRPGKAADPAGCSLGVTRRALVASAGLGVAGGFGLRALHADASPPIRPPGAREEGELVAACIRCGECIRICPTGGLKPMLLENGPLTMLTPKLVPRIGPCEVGCTACGNACPTGAIRALTVEQKEKIQIGLAGIDRERCLPWAQNVRCLVCHDACVYRAIDMVYDAGMPKPVVKEPLCIGCGICEFECPVEGESAIIVFSTR